jgi:CheY-like chemotaxis protein
MIGPGRRVEPDNQIVRAMLLSFLRGGKLARGALGSAATARPGVATKTRAGGWINPAKIWSQLKLFSITERKYVKRNSTAQHSLDRPPQMASGLVIDDDPVTRTVVRAALESAGHTVIEADNGHTGLVMFYAISPDLVITDIFMPQKDGIETIRELRAARPEIKILALSGDTGFDGPSMLDAAQLLGADQVLGKPFRNDELVRVVEQMLAAKPLLPLQLAEAHA